MKLSTAIIEGTIGLGLSIKVKPTLQVILIIWNRYIELEFNG